MPLRLPLILILAAALLAGCGRRGSLEAPDRPGAPPPPAVSEPALSPGEGTLLDPQSPGSQEPAQDRPVDAPERSFILDPLI